MTSTLTEPAGSIARSPESADALHLHGWEETATRQLAGLLEQIHSATSKAVQLVHGRCEAELNGKLDPSSWSVAECFDHLAQTTRAFLPAISNAVATAPKLTANRALQTGTLARLFIRNLEPPYRLRYKVLPQIAPQHQDFDAAWRGFLESQLELSEAVCCAAGRAIDRVTIKSPVYARIRYNVYGAFRMLAAHERRHLWQVQRIFTALNRAPKHRDNA